MTTSDSSVVADILESAADLIHRRGWTTGHYETEDGLLCALGAINVASGCHSLGSGSPLPAAVRLSVWLADNGFLSSITTWNDHSSKEEVIETLLTVAEEIRDKGLTV